jgi:ABC-type Zn uptake system ZnuABC Zn-binding protein ZnuA
VTRPLLRRHSTRPAAALALALLSGAHVGCARDDAFTGDGQGAASDPPTVVASIFPVYDLARFMGGGAVRVEVLLPPRASPSTFEPTARQMARLSGAAGYLFIGGGMDRWAEALVQPGDVVVHLTDGVQLKEGHAHEGDPGTGNPHVWLDPVLVRDRLLPRIEEVLADAAPAHAAEIRRRRAALADSLTALDREIRGALSGAASRAFVSTHSAWAYFADRYGLVEVGAVYESPGREPSSRHLAELVEGARAAGVGAVFVEPQLGEAGARAIAAELGVGVHLLDPQGGQEERDGYLSLMRFNARQLAAALGGRR